MSFINPEISTYQKVLIKTLGLNGIVLSNRPNEIGVIMDNGDYKTFKGKSIKNVLPLESVLYKTIKQSELEDLEHSDYPEKPGFDIENLFYKLTPKVGGKKTDNFEGINIKELDYNLKYYILSYKEAKKSFEKKSNFNNIEEFIKILPIEVLYKKFKTSEIAKIRSSFIYSCDKRYDFYFNNNPTLWLQKKISLSFHHTGYNTDWNTTVKAYNKVKSFNLGIHDLTLEIDTSSYYNSMGYSRFTRTFLDGEIAFIIKYKDQHVLTISFNFYKNKNNPSIEVCQIQCKNKKGNRFLYKFPYNYVDYILDRMYEHFEGFTFYLIKPELLKKRIKNDYETQLERYLSLNKNLTTDYTQEVEHYTKAIEDFNTRGIKSIENTYSKKLKHLKRYNSQNENFWILKKK